MNSNILIETRDISLAGRILSLFPENRDWNRRNIKNYYEVFIDTPLDVLIERDSKGIYARFNKGEISEVAGMDIHFQIPEKADLVIKNNVSRDSLLKHASQIIKKLHHSK